MEYVIMSVRDTKTEVFGRPFCLTSVGQGVRSFTDEVNRRNEDNVMFHHSGDFSLWQLGTYDDVTGLVTPCTPRLVVQANEVKEAKNVS